ncbi:MAG TPA: VanW family protein [Polyangiaceae bacterium]|nr:VanW family protein [Polyangiaceae bacterium]
MGWVDSWWRAWGRRATGWALLSAAGAAAVLLVLPPEAPGVDQAAPPPPARLGGEPLDLGAEGAGERALELVRKYAAAPVTLRLPGGRTRRVSRAALGAEIDRVYLAALVASARNPSSPLRRAHARGPKGAPLELPTAVVVNQERAMPALLSLKDELDTPPADARLDLDARKLVPERPGYRLDVYTTLARLDEAFARGAPEVEAAVEPLAPSLTAARLGNPSFDDVLGYFETHYAADKKGEARTFNLRLAASRLDGYVLLPGETFDFNKVVGPRNEASGYKVAPVIAQGELVDGLGGGTCQISGTLHAAAFFAGLEIASRTPHSRPSAYIRMGLDAAVAYPTINFKVKNPFPYPVVIHESVKDGVVRAEILGPKRRHTVTFVRKIDEVLPYQEQERPDPRLPQGVRVLSQRGVPGFKLHRYRVVREGPFALRERFNDLYPPTNQIVRVGTAADLPKDSPRPDDDNHAEYTADEFLSITQGVDLRPPKGKAEAPGGPTVESREAGRTGEPGWTRREGMPYWETKEDKARAASGEGEAGRRREAEGGRPRDGKGEAEGGRPRDGKGEADARRDGKGGEADARRDSKGEADARRKPKATHEGGGG